MRVLFSVVLLGALAVAGCAGRTAPSPSTAGSPRSGGKSSKPAASQTKEGLIVTPVTSLAGKVALVDGTARCVVVTLPLGMMPAADQRLHLYRRGLKVGEVKVTAWQRENNVVADLVAGEAAVGDEVRDQ